MAGLILYRHRKDIRQLYNLNKPTANNVIKTSDDLIGIIIQQSNQQKVAENMGGWITKIIQDLSRSAHHGYGFKKI